MRQSISLLLLLSLATACRHTYPQGQRIYETYCASCHMTDGSGLVWLIPPLAGADYLQTQRSEVPCIIRYGSAGGLEVNGVIFTEPMPAFPKLNEVELSNLINYINSSWGNEYPETSPAEIARYLGLCGDK